MIFPRYLPKPVELPDQAGTHRPQLSWFKPWVQSDFDQLWVVVDGGYAKRPFLRAAQKEGFVVVSRLHKSAALWSLPPTVRRPGQRGPMPTYGKEKISTWPYEQDVPQAGNR